MTSSVFHHKIVIFLIISILLLSGFLIVPHQVESWPENKFSNGSTKVTMTFETGGINNYDLAIEIPVNASVLSASLKVTGKEYNNSYPRNITINLGNDEDNEWEFLGTGYGALGKQSYYSDDTTKKYLKFTTSSTIRSNYIMLPRNATITNTSLSLEGPITSYNEDYFVCVDQYGYNLNYHQSMGGGSFAPNSSIDTNVGRYGYASCCMGDFDNDGDYDVVFGYGQSGNLYLYKKMGIGNNFAPRLNIGSITTSNYFYDFAAGDFNNDGNYDFLTSGSAATIYLFLGDGTGKFTSTSISGSGGPTTAWGKDAADFDKDGNLDFVCGGWGTGYVIYYYQGLGNGKFQNPTKISIPSSLYYGYTVITDDFNNDSKPDILTASSNGKMYFLEGHGNGTFKTGEPTDIDTGSYSGGDAYDYDNDGIVDVIAIDQTGTNEGSPVYFYKGVGNGINYSGPVEISKVNRNCYGGAAPPPKLNGTLNAKLDIGDTGTIDWEHNGLFENDIEDVPDFTQKLNKDILTSSKYTITRDDFGNEMMLIPLRFTSDNNYNKGLIRAIRHSIEYDYTATIYEKVKDDLISEMNEHIVYTDSDTITLHFIVISSTAGELEFTDLDVEYNLPPKLETEIPTLTAYEDVENLTLLDLSTYFSDIDEPTVNLNYSVVSNSASEHVDVFTNYTNMLKFRPITPNWFGETKVLIQVIDSGLKKTYSNQFTIIIEPVNDEPYPKHELPDIHLVEGGIGYDLDLMLKEYFTDVEEDYLYYSLAIDPLGLLINEQKQITAVMDEYNLVEIRTIDDFNTYFNNTNLPVPIWIYCDDDKYMNTVANGTGNYTRQEVLVTVFPVNDPPHWLSIPSLYLAEDDTKTFSNCMDLRDYLADDETNAGDLIVEVIGNRNPIIEVLVNNGYLSINPPADYYGSTTVMLRCTEENPEYKDETSFEIVIAPVNDAPEIELTSHINYQDVKDTEAIKGYIFDIENTIQLVEVKVDSHYSGSIETMDLDWQQASINADYNSWTYLWNTTTVPDGDYKLTARVYDGELTNVTIVNLHVNNGKNAEPIVDIIFPGENEEVNGSVLIKGTVYDPDHQGIVNFQIRIGQEMDWTEVPLDDKNGTVEWFFLWESTKVTDGNLVISAKAWDGISWSAPVNRLIDVNNGINRTAADSGDTTEGGSELSLLSIGIVALITIIIILGLIVMFVIIQRGNSRIKEYVPEGRIEPLEEVEAKLKPALVSGAAPEYAQLPVAVAVHGAAKPFSLLSAKPMHEALPALPPTTETVKQVETNTARIKI